MMYVKTNAPKASGTSPKRLTQMGVPMTEFKPSSAKKTTASYTKPLSKKAENGNSASKMTMLSPGKVIFFSLILGVFGLIYLTHVFSTQKHLKDVNQLQREYEKVKRLYADRKFTYDRMIGPAEVYDRAKKLGLKDGGPANGIIYVEGK